MFGSDAQHRRCGLSAPPLTGLAAAHSPDTVQWRSVGVLRWAWHRAAASRYRRAGVRCGVQLRVRLTPTGDLGIVGVVVSQQGWAIKRRCQLARVLTAAGEGKTQLLPIGEQTVSVVRSSPIPTVVNGAAIWQGWANCVGRGTSESRLELRQLIGRIENSRREASRLARKR